MHWIPLKKLWLPLLLLLMFRGSLSAAETAPQVIVLHNEISNLKNEMEVAFTLLDAHQRFADDIAIDQVNLTISRQNFSQIGTFETRPSERFLGKRVMLLFNTDTTSVVKLGDCAEVEAEVDLLQPLFWNVRDDLVGSIDTSVEVSVTDYDIRHFTHLGFSAGRAEIEETLCALPAISTQPDDNCLFDATYGLLSEFRDHIHRTQGEKGGDLIIFAPEPVTEATSDQDLLGERPISPCSGRTLREVVEFARTLGVRIHTIPISYPPTGTFEVEIDHGFDNLNALSIETGGLRMQESSFFNLPDTLAQFKTGYTHASTVTFDLRSPDLELLADETYVGRLIVIGEQDGEPVELAQTFTIRPERDLLPTQGSGFLKANLPLLFLIGGGVSLLSTGWFVYQAREEQRRQPLAKETSSRRHQPDTRKKERRGRMAWSSKRLSQETVDPIHEAWLKIEQSTTPSRVGEIQKISHFPYTIGREGCDLTLQDQNHAISRHHATIRTIQGILHIRDEKSANGTYVNGEPVEPYTETRLTDVRSSIRIGNHTTLLIAATREKLEAAADDKDV